MTGSPALRDLLQRMSADQRTVVVQRADRPEVPDARLPDRVTKPHGPPRPPRPGVVA